MVALKKGRLTFYRIAVAVALFTVGALLYILYIDAAQASIPSSTALNIKQVSAGKYHTCGIASDNWAYCWGEGSNGRLGNDSTNDQNTPVAILQGDIPAGATIRHMSAGEQHTCAIASDNKAYCWGWGDDGELGNGLTSQQHTPSAVSLGAMPSGSTIQQISSGDWHTCAIASDNKAYCWGWGAYGQLGNNTTPAAQLTPVAVSLGAMPSGATIRQISAGDWHTCAIASDNQEYCWGYGADGQLGDGANSQRNTPVAVSLGAMPSDSSGRQISSGDAHTCSIASDNKAYCWGGGANGRLGNGASGNSNIPVAVSLGAMPSGAMIRQVTAASSHTCAIASDNKAYCWGNAADGELGNGSTSPAQTTPVAVSLGVMPSGAMIQQISNGDWHACVVASDNQAYCWGYGGPGNLGNGANPSIQSTAVKVSPVIPIITVAQSVFRSYESSATVSPGSPLAATNTAAALSAIAGDFRIRIGLTNQEETTSLTIDSLSTEEDHTCAIASDSKGYCWGIGSNGRLGNGTTTAAQDTPVPVSQGAMPSGATLLQISPGATHTCAIASDYKAYCWGSGSQGELGNGTKTTTQTTPVAVSQGAMPAGATIRQISAGNESTCVIASDNKAYCWGNANQGALGYGGSSDQTTPVAVVQGAMPAGATILQIEVGEAATCAVASDHKAYCWGEGNNGAIGNGLLVDQLSPVAVLQGAVPSGVTIRQVDANGDHACAVGSDNKAYCWGQGGDGRLGNATSGDQTSPVAVLQGAMPAGVTVRSVKIGEAQSCALASDNKAYCWGDGTNGRLGTGSTSDQGSPATVLLGAMPAGTTIVHVTSGLIHTCALASNSKVYCWGGGASGRLGTGSSPTSQTTPLAVSQGLIPNRDTTIAASQLDLSLQVAPLGVESTCATVSTGWTNVTTTSDMNWGSAPPSHTTSISSFGSDPTAPTGGGYSFQSIVQSGSFSNPQPITPQQTGLWDFVLHDRSSLSSATYCFRVVSNTAGTSIDTYSQYPQITTATGSLDVGFVDNGGAPVVGSAADTPFPAVMVSDTIQSPAGEFLTSASKQLELYNSLTGSGWSVSLAATEGPTARWESGSYSYDYNDESTLTAEPGADGVLSVIFALGVTSSSFTSHGTAPDGSACSSTGIALPGDESVAYTSAISAITLLTGNPSSQFNCRWRLKDVTLMQLIPGGQDAGLYTLDMTATVVAN